LDRTKWRGLMPPTCLSNRFGESERPGLWDTTGRRPHEGFCMMLELLILMPRAHNARGKESECWIPRANSARGKVRGALPRIPARGTPPETPAPFPSNDIFQNGPRRQGSATPRKKRAPLTAPGRSERLTEMRERGLMQSVFACSGASVLAPRRASQKSQTGHFTCQ